MCSAFHSLSSSKSELDNVSATPRRRREKKGIELCKFPSVSSLSSA
ncbi:hypothetical protein OIU84_028476 [Salix udensis]|uniref:Uncharacterized protein n=1 Tax=Salix udensis TaxID=889485 RepID=A0AAD6KCP4_9ROSI|nr:hypothetical protein OIU84_028476 [Salix udensis]